VSPGQCRGCGLCSAVGPGVSGVRLKGRNCQMTAASGLCWSVGTSQYHKANLSGEMSKGTACFHIYVSAGFKSGTLLHGRVGGCEASGKWQMRCASRVAWQKYGQARPGRLAKTDIASTVGRLTKRYWSCENRESPQVD
jgi:hypothetical protein